MKISMAFVDTETIGGDRSGARSKNKTNINVVVSTYNETNKAE